MMDKILAWLIVMIGITVAGTIVMSFAALAFHNPFETEVGRFVWIVFMIWAGLRISRIHED